MSDTSTDIRRAACHITDEEIATLCKIFGVRDPGQDVSRATFSIDWGSGEVSASFTYGVYPDVRGGGGFCRAYAPTSIAQAAESICADTRQLLDKARSQMPTAGLE